MTTEQQFNTEYVLERFYPLIEVYLDVASNRKIAERLAGTDGKSERTIQRYVAFCRKYHKNKNLRPDPEKKEVEIISDKKLPEGGWRELADYARHGQQIKEKFRVSQSKAEVVLGVDHPIVIVPLGDLHLGAIGTNYDQFIQMTEEILSTPELYVYLIGDELELAIKTRNVKEMLAGQVLTPELQVEFFEKWLEEISHKIIAATWGNHVQEREEKVVGYSIISRIIGKKHNIIYHNGIGHLDLTVGSQTYKFALSHKFQGRSYLNDTHSQQRYMRFQGQDRDICIAGDIHKPAFQQYFDGERQRLAVTSGTLNVDSGYAKRYYSLFTQPVFPVVELHPDEKHFVPFMSLRHWEATKKKRKPIKSHA